MKKIIWSLIGILLIGGIFAEAKASVERSYGLVSLPSTEILGNGQLGYEMAAFSFLTSGSEPVTGGKINLGFSDFIELGANYNLKSQITAGNIKLKIVAEKPGNPGPSLIVGLQNIPLSNIISPGVNSLFIEVGKNLGIWGNWYLGYGNGIFAEGASDQYRIFAGVEKKLGAISLLGEYSNPNINVGIRYHWQTIEVEFAALYDYNTQTTRGVMTAGILQHSPYPTPTPKTVSTPVPTPEAVATPLPTSTPTPEVTPVVTPSTKLTPTPTPIEVVDINITDFNTAKQHYDEGEYAKAAFDFKDLLKKYPSTQHADLLNYYLGLCYQKLGFFPTAIVYFQNIIANYPESKWVEPSQYLIGTCYIDPLNKKPDYQLATEAFQKVIEKYPHSEWIDEAQSGLGFVLLGQREYGKAMAQFQKVVTEYPNTEGEIAAHYGIGRVYQAGRKWMEARSIFEMVIKNYPNSEYASLAKTALKEIEIEIKKPLGNPQKDYEAALNLYFAGKITEAIEKLNFFIQNYPTSILMDNVFYWLGECYYDQDDYNTAISYFQKTLDNQFYDKEDPDYAKKDDAQLKLGICYYKLKNYPQAYLGFQKLIERYPQSEYISKAKEYLELEELKKTNL